MLSNGIFLWQLALEEARSSPSPPEGKIQFKLGLGAINLGPQEGMLKKGSSALTILRSGFLVRACREMRF